MGIKLITSEATRAQHPDLTTNHIVNSILSNMFEQDKNQPHAGLEALLYRGGIVIGGEMKTSAYIDIPEVVRQAVLELGYNSNDLGLDGNTMAVANVINKQSPDIDCGVVSALETRGTNGDQEIGAGDQGIMLGFAIDETEQLLPLPIVIAQGLMNELDKYREVNFLGLDGKGQVTIAYDEETDKPLYVDTIVISNCHRPGSTVEEIRAFINDYIIPPVLRKYGFDIESVKHIYINPTGAWNSIYSCSAADCGVVGRKLAVSSYGAYPGSGIGGGAFDGKDPSKTDFSGMVAARWVAKNIVAAKLAKKCSVTIGYAIGIAKPVSVYVDTFGTGKFSDSKLAEAVNKVFLLTPKGIIEALDLYNPTIYKHLTTRGLFDQADDFKWEKTDKVEELLSFMLKA